MIKEIKDAKFDRKKLRMALIAASMVPHLPTQLRFKYFLTMLDKQDYENGRISKNAYNIKRILRFVPMGGLTMAAYDVGAELLSEGISFSVDSLSEMSNAELELLYSQVKKA